MHDLLIGILIIIIVAIQVYVFLITLNKIKIYKKIIPEADNFKTIKVFINEKDIESVKLVDLFKNLNMYSENPEPNSIHTEPEIIENDVFFGDNDDLNNYYSSDSSSCEVSKDGEIMRVSKDIVGHYKSLGWIEL